MNIINLKDKNLYYIGGVVRDEILGCSSIDVDLTYDGDAIEFAKNIQNAEIVQINEPFGTVRIKLDGKELDIASTRTETYPYKGHLPIVERIGCSLQEDVLRRDFTINTLAKSSLTGEIIDYAGGLKDIENKIIRVLHDESFIDDPTRIVRALKFAVRFGFELDEHTQELQKQYLENINYDMSYKRLKKELIETLNSREAFKRFIEQKIYKLVTPLDFKLPEYDFTPFIEKYKPQNVWLIYVGLLPDISNLPLTKEEKKIIEEFKSLKCRPNNTKLHIESVIMYSTIDPEFAQLYLDKLRYIKLEINGNDLKSLNIKPSQQYQKCFEYILEKKYINPKLTKADEIKLAKEFFNIV